MYLGPDTVLTALPTDDDMVIITLESGKVLKWKKVMYEFCSTKEPSNPTALQDSRILKTTQLIIRVMLDVDIKLSELPTLYIQVENFINEKLDAGTANLWIPHMYNKADVENPSGLQTLQERTLNDLNNLLVKDGKNKDNNTGKSDTPASKGDSSDSGSKKN